jgi:hypothetical protein
MDMFGQVNENRFGNNLRIYTRLTNVRERESGLLWIDVRLSVKNSRGPGSRFSPTSGRRVSAACWHAHGYFFDALPTGTKIQARGHTFRSGDVWRDWNIGSVMNRCRMSESCECR